MSKWKFITIFVGMLILATLQPAYGQEKTEHFATDDTWKMYITDVQITGERTMKFFSYTDINTTHIGAEIDIRVGKLFEPEDNLFISNGDFHIKLEGQDEFTIETRLAYLPSYGWDWFGAQSNYYAGPAIYADWGFTGYAATADTFVKTLDGERYITENTYEEMDELAIIKYTADRALLFKDNYYPYFETVEMAYFLDNGILAYFKNIVSYTIFDRSVNLQSTYVHEDCFNKIHSCNGIMSPETATISSTDGVSSPSSVSSIPSSGSNTSSEGKKSDKAGIGIPINSLYFSLVVTLLIYKKRKNTNYS